MAEANNIEHFKHKTEFLSLGEYENDDKWKDMHPENWLPDDVISWIYSLANERADIDPDKLRGEAFNDLSGQQLSNMSRQDFANKDRNYGELLHTLFNQLCSEAQFFSPSQSHISDNINLVNSALEELLKEKPMTIQEHVRKDQCVVNKLPHSARMELQRSSMIPSKLASSEESNSNDHAIAYISGHKYDFRRGDCFSDVTCKEGRRNTAVGALNSTMRRPLTFKHISELNQYRPPLLHSSSSLSNTSWDSEEGRFTDTLLSNETDLEETTSVSSDGSSIKIVDHVFNRSNCAGRGISPVNNLLHRADISRKQTIKHQRYATVDLCRNQNDVRGAYSDHFQNDAECILHTHPRFVSKACTPLGNQEIFPLDSSSLDSEDKYLPTVISEIINEHGSKDNRKQHKKQYRKGSLKRLNNGSSGSASPKTPRKRGRKKGQISTAGNHLWEFLLELLSDPKFSPEYIKWENREQGIFCIVKSQEVATLWGNWHKKKNQEKNEL